MCVRRGRDFAAAIQSFGERYGDPRFDACKEHAFVADKGRDWWISTTGRSTVFDPPAEFLGDAGFISCSAEEYDQLGPLATAKECTRRLLWRINSRNDGADPNLPITTGLDHIPHEGPLDELPALIRALDELERRAGPEPAVERQARADDQLVQVDEASVPPSVAPRKNRTRKQNEKSLIKAIKKATAEVRFGCSIETMAKAAGVAPSSAKKIFKDNDGDAAYEWSTYKSRSKERRPPGK
jgi:hypothetical protein